MKVLILSITAGNGHNATGRAVQDHLESRDVTCRFIDTFSEISPPLASFTENTFLFSAKFAKKPYAFSYRMLELKKKTDENSPVLELFTNLAQRLREYVEDYAPDVIVSSHVFPCILMNMLKTKYKMKFYGIGILTDFAFHPFWEDCTALDKLVIPNDLLELEGLKKGYTRQQLLPIGIPIRERFSEADPAKGKAVKEKLGLDPQIPTVLVMSGSMGHGAMSKTVKLLDKLPMKLQILAVCGNNSAEKQKIERLKTSKKVIAFGWVDRVDRLMDVSDCLITKPGGITTSEALAKRIPIVMIDPLPGQEDRNVEFLLNNGVAVYATKTNPLDNVLFQLLNNPGRLDSLRKSMDYIRRPDSTRALGDFILSLKQ